jgi:cysteine desulfurase
LISPVEHHAVSWTARQLASDFGFNVHFMRVDNYGLVDLTYLEDFLKNNKVCVVSLWFMGIMKLAQINPISEIDEYCQRYEVRFIATLFRLAHISRSILPPKTGMLSVSGHKLYGPKGMGFL